MITHDLGVVAEVADDVVVMYAARGRRAGEGRRPLPAPEPSVHLGAARLAAAARRQDVERLVQIPGQPPSLLNPPRGCRFHPRCPYVMRDLQGDRARAAAGPESHEHHRVRCHLDQETKDREAAKVLEGDSRRSADGRGTGAGDGGVLELDRQRAPRRRGRQEALPGHARDHLPEADRAR